MSGARNLHRIMSSQFMHSKPNLCPACQHRQEHGEWEGYCTVKHKILSAPKSLKGRCADYAEQSTGANPLEGRL